MEMEGAWCNIVIRSYGGRMKQIADNVQSDRQSWIGNCCLRHLIDLSLGELI